MAQPFVNLHATPLNIGNAEELCSYAWSAHKPTNGISTEEPWVASNVPDESDAAKAGSLEDVKIR